MNYLLTVLTNGRREYLERTLAAFFEHATPRPAVVYVMDDGGQTGGAFVQELAMRHGFDGVYADSPAPLGMCAAHARCWQTAADSSYDWAVHIEDDYVLLRPVDLELLAAVLDKQPHLCQMTLMRTPWGMEVEHGGYVAQTPGWYHRMGMDFNGCEDAFPPAAWFATRPEAEWMETTRNWANAPTLFRTDLARRVSWPAEPGCETTIGPRIIEAYGPDTRFGLWGWGEAQCAHVGVDRAPRSGGY